MKRGLQSRARQEGSDMPGTNLETFSTYRMRAGSTANGSGLNCVTSGFAVIGGIAFLGTATGQIQLFAGMTCSASITPVITFCGTTSAVAGGFSPMFLRFPMAVSGSGFCVDTGTSGDTNLILFWAPMGTTT